MTSVQVFEGAGEGPTRAFVVHDDDLTQPMNLTAKTWRVDGDSLILTELSFPSRAVLQDAREQLKICKRLHPPKSIFVDIHVRVVDGEGALHYGRELTGIVLSDQTCIVYSKVNDYGYDKDE